MNERNKGEYWCNGAKRVIFTIIERLQLNGHRNQLHQSTDTERVPELSQSKTVLYPDVLFESASDPVLARMRMQVRFDVLQNTIEEMQSAKEQR